MFSSFMLKIVGVIASVVGGLMMLFGILIAAEEGINLADSFFPLGGLALLIYGRYLEYVSDHSVRMREQMLTS